MAWLCLVGSTTLKHSLHACMMWGLFHCFMWTLGCMTGATKKSLTTKKSLNSPFPWDTHNQVITQQSPDPFPWDRLGLGTALARGDSLRVQTVSTPSAKHGGNPQPLFAVNKLTTVRPSMCLLCSDHISIYIIMQYKQLTQCRFVWKQMFIEHKIRQKRVF